MFQGSINEEPDVTDRRRERRIAYDGKAYVTYGGKCHSDTVIDISEHGARIDTNTRIRAGRNVRLYIPLPSDQGWRLCFLDGTVVRRERKLLDGGQYAVKFDQGLTPARRLLKDFIANQAA